MSTRTIDRGIFTAGLHRLREWFAARRERLSGTDEELTPIASEIGVSVVGLREIARRGPRAADELPQMMAALGLEASTIARRNALLLRDLQRICSACGAKARCRCALADGAAAAQFEEFCPNRATLRALR